MATILIIEDNHMNLEISRELLENSGHTILSSETAQEGILQAKSKSPDLILMDLSLPQMDGLSATKILKKDPITKHIPIIAFTAMIMKSDKEKAYGAGCSGFISKPIDISTFSKIVESYLPEQFKTEIQNKPISNLFNPSQQEGQPTYKENLNKWHKVLIVDDNSINAEILKELLEQINQTPIIAYNAKEALSLIEEHVFDLILLDVMMPDIDGFELMGKLKEHPKTYETPVIFVSALGETNNIVKGLDLGSHGYITKPFNIEEVKSRVLCALRTKDLQDNLKAEKAKLELIYKFSADGIIMINSRFEILSCNEQFCKWFMMSEQEIIGKNFFNLINRKKSQEQNQEQHNNLSDEIILDNPERQITLQVHHSKILNLKSETEGYVLVLRDVSLYKEIEKQKETFVATLTHDLKTPIRAESNALKLLLKGTFGSLSIEQKDIIQETLNSSKYLQNMVDNLLSTYKYENGSMTITKEKTDINRLIKNSFNEMKYLFDDKRQNVIFEFDNEKTTLSVDPMEMKRVVINLLSNANKYTQNSGEITVKTSLLKDIANISITDNGKGMSKEDLSTLFERYSSYAHKFKEVGTGLGLYLSKKIIEEHDGKIKVESQEGQGSCFSFTVPVE